MSFQHIGTLIHGTGQPRDTIPAMLELLQELDAERAQKLREEYAETVDNLENRLESQADEDETPWLTEDLYDALQEHAPIGCYFGAHEGDSSDLGFWPDHDWIEEAKRDGYAIGHDRVIYDGVILEINERGNTEVWEIATGPSIWSCV